MKRLAVLVLFFFLFVPSFAQESYFHELRGMEDSTGTTHLFYRLYDSSEEIIDRRRPYENHLYHYNTITNTDTLYLVEETIDPGEELYNDFYTFRGFKNYSFIRNDLSKLIYTNLLHFEPPSEFIDSQGILDWNGTSLAYGGGFFSDVSNPNSMHDRIIISIGDIEIYSFIYEVDSTGYDIFTCLEINDCTQIEGLMLAQNPKSEVIYNLKGDTIYVLNNNLEEHFYIELHPSLKEEYFSDQSIRFHNFYFDNDSLTFYSNNYNTLYRYNYSNSQKTDSLGSFSSATIDTKNSGHIYVSTSTVVLFSSDFGESFQTFVDIEKPITGLYKKPNSDSLFILTRDQLLTYTNGELVQSEIILLENELDHDLPKSIQLHQNYPNPFNPSTTIPFTLNRGMDVKLNVYDLLGREVAVLVDEFKNVGSYEIRFDASTLTSGVYFYRLEADGMLETKRFTLIK